MEPDGGGGTARPAYASLVEAVSSRESWIFAEREWVRPDEEQRYRGSPRSSATPNPLGWGTYKPQHMGGTQEVVRIWRAVLFTIPADRPVVILPKSSTTLSPVFVTTWRCGAPLRSFRKPCRAVTDRCLVDLARTVPSGRHRDVTLRSLPSDFGHLRVVHPQREIAFRSNSSSKGVRRSPRSASRRATETRQSRSPSVHWHLHVPRSMPHALERVDPRGLHAS